MSPGVVTRLQTLHGVYSDNLALAQKAQVRHVRRLGSSVTKMQSVGGWFLNGSFKLLLCDQDLFQQYFISDEESQPGSLLSLIWRLFVAARHTLLTPPPHPDLHHSEALLLACFNIILGSTPSDAVCLRHRFADTACFPYRILSSGSADTLSCLLAVECNNDPQAHPELATELYKLLPKFVQAIDAFLADMVRPAGLLPVGSTEAHRATDNNSTLQDLPDPQCRVYPGLIGIDGTCHSVAVAMLESYINTMVLPCVDIDEIALLQDVFEDANALIPTGDVENNKQILQAAADTMATRPSRVQTLSADTGAGMAVFRSNSGLGFIEGAPQGPWQESRQGTPAENESRLLDADRSVSWLRGVVQPEEDAFSALKRITNAEVMQSVTNTVHGLLGNKELSNRTPHLLGQYLVGVAAQYGDVLVKQMTLSLFVQAICELTRSEAERGGRSIRDVVNKLLSSHNFVRCILMLSTECVAAGLPGTPHPTKSLPCAEPERFGVEPFDLVKLISPFVLAFNSGLPRRLKHHLVRVEERIIDCTAWREGSSLYDALRSATGHSSMGSNAPVALHGVPPPGADAAAHAVLASFVAKASKLSALRLMDLMSRIDVAGSIVPVDVLLHQAYTIVRLVLWDYTWLIFGRHLDHIMLCTLYGTCRANRATAATFKSILAAYKAQPQARQETFRSVSMAGRPDSVHRNASPSASAPQKDIIAFYNEIFLPEASSLLHDVTTGKVPLAAFPHVHCEAPKLDACTHSPTASPWYQRILSSTHQTPRAPSKSRLSPSQRHTMGCSPGTVKLSPGRWKMTPMGTQLLTPFEEEHMAPVTHGQERGRSKRKLIEAVENQVYDDTKRQHYASPVDALLAAAANAEEELRRIEVEDSEPLLRGPTMRNLNSDFEGAAVAEPDRKGVLPPLKELE